MKKKIKVFNEFDEHKHIIDLAKINELEDDVVFVIDVKTYKQELSKAREEGYKKACSVEYTDEEFDELVEIEKNKPVEVYVDPIDIDFVKMREEAEEHERKIRIKGEVRDLNELATQKLKEVGSAKLVKDTPEEFTEEVVV